MVVCDDLFAGNCERPIELPGPGGRDPFEQSNPGLVGIIMPRRLANEIQPTVHFDEHTPAGRRFGVAKQFVRQDQKKQICAAIPDEALELGSTLKASLESCRLPQNPPITTVTDAVKIV